MTEPPSDPTADAKDRISIDLIQAALRGLRYGEVRIVVQDGVVVQVEKTERMRPSRAD
jgi:hypothetical protein